ncbi:unnamed protein product [Staurois parvus]|uniref:Cytochrome c oxidase subunit I n=1 Tax=Staurois parvus TaxID=386267 RepID=A0ABN9GGD9_9NEOB|nr:unnamed protein product [Staurois parvus]
MNGGLLFWVLLALCMKEVFSSWTSHSHLNTHSNPLR